MYSSSPTLQQRDREGLVVIGSIIKWFDRQKARQREAELLLLGIRRSGERPEERREDRCVSGIGGKNWRQD
jgi:hypothetical protein